MRILIVAPGSRGDVEPYLALGTGLVQAGNAVSILTTRDHEARVVAAGFGLFSVDLDVQAALQKRDVSGSLEAGGFFSSFRQLKLLAERGAQLTAEAGLRAGAETDLVVTGFGGAFMAEGIARKFGVPLVQAYNVPLTPTAAFAGPLLPRLDFGPRSRKLGHLLTRAAVWMTARGSGNRARMQVLGAPSAPMFVSSATPGLVPGRVIYGYSPAFLPVGPEWGADVEVTGFWFGAADETPNPALEAFLAAGEPPVCIGFGSMSQTNPKATTALVLEAVRQSGLRAVLLAGWGGLTASDLPANVLALPQASHASLYPRCAAVVHHGGAGTTAAALRAGVPALVVPSHGDQDFWARRVHAAGTGPAPIPRRRLTVKALAAGLREAEAFRSKAAALGAVIRSENGVGRAVAAILRK